MFFAFSPLTFYVADNRTYCVVATRTDGTRYLVQTFDTLESAEFFSSFQDDLTVVYSGVLDLIKSF